MDILLQLGGLMLGSVPTIVFFLLLILAYTVLVQRPLERTLAERRERTQGAVEQARGAISAAEAETTVYEDKLRSARSEILAARARRLQQLQADREAALAAARSAAQERIQGARAELERTSEAARKQIEGATLELSEQILRAVLPQGARVSGAAQ